MLQAGLAQIGVRQQRRLQGAMRACAPVAQVGTAEVQALPGHIGKIRFPEIGTTQICRAKLTSLQLRPLQVCLGPAGST